MEDVKLITVSGDIMNWGNLECIRQGHESVGRVFVTWCRSVIRPMMIVHLQQLDDKYSHDGKDHFTYKSKSSHTFANLAIDE